MKMRLKKPVTSIMRDKLLPAGKERKSGGNFKIAYTLNLAFMVPVLMIIVLGVLSYKSAADYITEQYIATIDSELISSSSYLELLCNNLESKMTEIVAEDALVSCYGRFSGKNDYEAVQCANDVTGILTRAKAACKYIYSFAIISKDGRNMTSQVNKKINADAYEEYIKTQEAERVTKGKGIWGGYHTYLDSCVGTDCSEYGLTYVRRLNKGDGYLISDIDYSTITVLLDGMMSKDRIVALVTPDGREIVAGREEVTKETVFATKSFYVEAQESGISGHTYIEYEGKKQLYAYAPIGRTGIMLCVLVPETAILGVANSIKTLTVMMVIAAVIVALFIGIGIANGISREVTGLASAMNRVVAGDFTVTFTTGRRDEFKILTLGISVMLEHIRQLFGRMKSFLGMVDDSMKDVSEVTEFMAESMQNINEAMEEVSSGVARQVTDVDDGLNKMSILADRLNVTYDFAQKTEVESSRMMAAVDMGEEQTKRLNEKTEVVVTITDKLVNDIKGVASSTAYISDIVLTIQDIAEQTNLLSLNASIEAARAGERGRGFSVVAEEIRKLSNQSRLASDRIKEIIDNIQNTMRNTTDCVEQTEYYLKQQGDEIRGTIAVFGEISSLVESMIGSLHDIRSNMSDMMKNKDEVLDVMRSVVAVSQETASSSEEVTATVNVQMERMRDVAKNIGNLAREVSEINDSMCVYKV